MEKPKRPAPPSFAKQREKRKQEAAIRQVEEAKLKAEQDERVARRKARELELIEAQKPIFLRYLRKSANVTYACKMSGMKSYTAYTLQKSDEEFAQKWDEALTVAIECLELVARQRAEKGVEEYVMYQGEICYERDEDGDFKRDDFGERIPIKICRPSDRLLEFLLKAHKPEMYSENVQVDHAVKGGIIVINAEVGATGKPIEDLISKQQEKFRKGALAPPIDVEVNK